MYNQARPGQYGGGFIELLMTGRDPGQPLRQVRQPPQPSAPANAAYRYVDPFDEPQVEREPERRRMAALPAAPHEAVPLREPSPEYQRQIVSFDGPEAPGTIVIDTPSRFLYLVQPGGQAIRYGIGVGRPGFTWAGVKTITAKREWPGWTPPPQMLKRRPDLPRHMEGGPDNPLGARALYLGSSLYRIHGTNEPHTIGQNVSSGCIRMMNEDVMDLYERVRVGTRVKVI
ncbi:L,D-transpeptidase [Enterovirga sp. DB1703]|uniref:L,D-transpeptidase n=2 Tax=Enterovirga aerilata TaxID=2730920 RepID=A0A849I1D6_9HYPH|nr:L,D-transpeptidase [Enterovirga sp. DB1703]NNM73172.1 L,D-transpeptidase [Enterovirga sp. DB1703]